MFCGKKQKKSLTGKVCLHEVCSMVIIQAHTENPHYSPAISLTITPVFLLDFSFLVESTVVPKHAVKAYRGSEGIASLINLANTTGKQGPVGPRVSLGASKKRKIHSSCRESIRQPAA